MSDERNKEKGGSESVRSRAYDLWEKEGRPHGKDKDHWSRAEQEFGSESGGASSADAVPDAESRASTTVADIPVVRRKPGAPRKASKKG